MISLNVQLTYPSGRKVRCGTVVCGNPDKQGRIQGVFRYEKTYLSDPDAFALDPIHLPLGDKEFDARRPCGIHGVLEDALPDDWGRRLLARRAGKRYLSEPDMLRLAGSLTMGALSFESEGAEPPPNHPPVTLSDLMEASMSFERGEAITDDRLQMLYTVGGTFGGARPKAIISDQSGEWIAKFPSVKDTFNNPAIEAATLSLAKDAGLDVPDFRLETLPTVTGSSSVLLVRRFDLSELGGRIHLVSFKTLMDADGYYNESYENLALTLRKASSDPVSDLPALYRQMVFNALIGNTDDHLKNFTMIHAGDGYRLSPAYDLLPNVSHNAEHVLSFGPASVHPGRETLIALHRYFALNAREAEEILSQTREAITGWRDRFASFGVLPDDIERLARDIDRRRMPPESSGIVTAPAPC